MEMYTCGSCGYDVSDHPQGICPNCKVDLSGIRCLGCSNSGPKKVFVDNDNRCPKCGALVYIPEGPTTALVKTDSTNPIVVANTAIMVWPLLMYFTGFFFLAAANSVLFMSYGSISEFDAVTILFLIVFSLCVMVFNIIIIGQAVASAAVNVFDISNQNKVIAGIYAMILMLFGLTGHAYLSEGANIQTAVPLILVLLLSWGGAIIVTGWFGSRARADMEALQAQTVVDTSVMDTYTGIYDETKGLNTLKFDVVYGNLCVGVPDADYLTKTIALGHNRFELEESDGYVFTFVDGVDHDLIAGDGQVTRYYQRIGS